MDASTVAPSFLCFLSDFQCASANIIYINGISETTTIQHVSGKAVSLALADKVSHEILGSTNRTLNASTESKSCFSNDFSRNTSSPGGNICAERVEEKEAAVESLKKPVDTVSYISPKGIMENGAQHEVFDLDKATNSRFFENREPATDQGAECSDIDVAVEDIVGEIDVLAFQITEFFDAFRDGQEYKLLRLSEKSDRLVAESLLDPECDQWSAKLIQSRTDKEATFADVNRIEGRISSSASRSGKWNGFLEGDSFPGTFSGQISFSGPISISGNSGHGPCSGSVSHRSDSSTGSTHSFAFPILPYDWNSSPVRMSQPDKRFMQKPWKRRLRSVFCCGSFK